MVNHDEEQKEEANEEGYVSGQPTYLFSILGGDLEGYLFVYDRYSYVSVFELVVQLDLFVDLFSQLQESDLLISLSFSLNPHHDTVSSI